MGEGDGYGCKTYFLISLEGILFLLQLVSESRTTTITSGFFRVVLSGTFDCLEEFFGFDSFATFSNLL